MPIHKLAEELVVADEETLRLNHRLFLSVVAGRLLARQRSH